MVLILSFSHEDVTSTFEKRFDALFRVEKSNANRSMSVEVEFCRVPTYDSLEFYINQQIHARQLSTKHCYVVATIEGVKCHITKTSYNDTIKAKLEGLVETHNPGVFEVTLVLHHLEPFSPFQYLAHFILLSLLLPLSFFGTFVWMGLWVVTPMFVIVDCCSHLHQLRVRAIGDKHANSIVDTTDNVIRTIKSKSQRFFTWITSGKTEQRKEEEEAANESNETISLIYTKADFIKVVDTLTEVEYYTEKKKMILVAAFDTNPSFYSGLIASALRDYAMNRYE